jgi:SAM-dependent methyltransferase
MSFSLRFKDYQKLFQLAKARNNSPRDYYAFEEFQGELLVRFLKNRGVLFDGCVALDLGCGLGGYTVALQKGGARVVGLDIAPTHDVGRNLLVSADGLKAPFAAEQFDLVICASLIEHIPEPVTLLFETLRLLKRNGVLYLSYPPYYSPLGGHQFSPFHLFGERFALWIARQRGLFKEHAWLQEKFPARPAAFENAYGSWGLYKLTIAKVKKEIQKLPVEVIECSTRWLPIDFSRVPVLGEFLTWHVQFLLRKK